MTKRQLREFHSRFPKYAVTLMVLNVTMGLIRLLESPARHSGPILNDSKHVLPIRVWGLLFLLVGIALCFTYLRPTIFRFVASMGLVLWVFWTTILAVGTFYDKQASFSVAMLYAAATIRHIQVTRNE